MAAFTSMQSGPWSDSYTWEGLTVTARIDNGGGGYSETGGGWNTQGGQGYGGSMRYAGPSGSGTNTASWQFTGLNSAKTYRVAITWPQDSNRATNTPWQILDSDGSTVLSSGTINQELVPIGYPDSGFDWLVLSAGTQPSGTSLTVKITDNANEYVIADACGITELPAGPGAGPVPGIGDTVEIDPNHNVTVDEDTVVGTSPADEDEYVITVHPAGTLTVDDDITLEVRGAMLLDGIHASNVASLVLEEGSVLEFDSSAATGTPSYLLSCAGGTAAIVANGTPSNRATIRSNVGGDPARILETNTGPGRPNFDLAYADIELAVETTSAEILLDNCVLSAGGQLSIFSSGTDVDCADSHFSGGSGFSFPGTFAVDGGTTRNWLRNSFAANLPFKFTAATIEDNYFGGGIQDVNNGVWTSLARNFISADDFVLTASASNDYILTDHNDGNPHSVLPESGVTFSGSVIEYTGDNWGVDPGNCFYAPSSTGCTFSENIVGPNAHGLGASGAVTFANVAGCDVYKNSLFASEYSGGILLGDGAGNTGTYPNVKGNIFWVGLSDGFTGLAATAIDTTTDNILMPGGCTHNLCVNLASTRYQGDYPTTQPGASDTVVTGVNVLTILHDPYRNIASWAVERGSVEVDYDDQKADALAYMLADPSLVLALVTHVKAGSAIINGTYKGLAHDGFDHGPAWRPIPLEPATADGDEVTFADWNHTLDTGVVPDAADFVFGSGRTCSGVTVNAGSLVLTGVSPVYDGSVVGDYVTYVPGADPITADDTSESERWAATVNDETAGGGYTLTADAGALAIAGTSATLRRTRIMPADAGAVAIAGTAATLSRTRVLAAGSGSVEIQGQSAQLRYSGNPGDFVSAGTFISAGPPSVF